VKVELCDICKRKVNADDKGVMGNGALAIIAKAETVCKQCAQAATAVDWCAVVREAWMKE